MQIVLNHSGFRVEAASNSTNEAEAISVTAEGECFYLSRQEAEALQMLVNVALDMTGPREKRNENAVGPRLAFLEKQAD